MPGSLWSTPLLPRTMAPFHSTITFCANHGFWGSNRLRATNASLSQPNPICRLRAIGLMPTWNRWYINPSLQELTHHLHFSQDDSVNWCTRPPAKRMPTFWNDNSLLHLLRLRWTLPTHDPLANDQQQSLIMIRTSQRHQQATNWLRNLLLQSWETNPKPMNVIQHPPRQQQMRPTMQRSSCPLSQKSRRWNKQSQWQSNKLR